MTKYRVATAHSEYLIDDERQTYSRSRVHDLANKLRYDTEERTYATLNLPLLVGESIVLSEHDRYWIRSTPIVSIEVVE